MRGIDAALLGDFRGAAEECHSEVRCPPVQLFSRLLGLLISQIAPPTGKAQGSFLMPAHTPERHTKSIVTSHGIHLFSHESPLQWVNKVTKFILFGAQH